MTDWSAIVLTGGGSTRLGQDKATAVVAGHRMIDRVLAQLPAEVPVIVVGPDPIVSRAVIVTREDPPGGGPAAGIAAGLAHVHTPVVAVIAADMPFAVPLVLDLLELLVDDAVVPVADGHPQPLCAVYSTDALAAAGLRAGASMKAVLAGLRVTSVPVGRELVADIDTPTDLAEVERIMEVPTLGGHMQDWVDAVTQELGLTAEVDIALILDVAKDAAHGVQRPAAPVTTYLLGLAVAGGADPAAAAAAIGRLANSWTPTPDA